MALALPAAAAVGDLIISEYIEGSSNNKAIEIFNGSDRAIDLTAGSYVLQLYYNGATVAGDTIALQGTLPPNGAYVMCHASATNAIKDRANLVTGALKFNGDDALVLRRGGAAGTVVDSLGRVGEDPGTHWGSATNKTVDMTLRRKYAVTAGDRVPDDAFDPALEWEALPCDTCDGLGVHAMQPEGFLLRVSVAQPSATSVLTGGAPPAAKPIRPRATPSPSVAAPS